MTFARSMVLAGLPLAAACHGDVPSPSCGDCIVDETEGSVLAGDGSEDSGGGTEDSGGGTEDSGGGPGSGGTEDSGGSEDSGDEFNAVPEPGCVTLVDSPFHRVEQYGVYVTPDGRVLIAGEHFVGYPDHFHAGVWAFDIQGTPLWSRDFGRDRAYSIHPRGEGFAFVHARREGDHTFARDIVSLDAAGNVVETVVLWEGEPYFQKSISDWIETPSGLLVGGGDQGDFWLGHVDGDGVLETLVKEDYAYGGGIQALRRHENVIGALVNVVGSVYDVYIYPDMYEVGIGSTLLVEYDEEGVELRRTLLSSTETFTSWMGQNLDVADDGTWILSGQKYVDHNPDGNDEGLWGWAAGVRDGEVLWTFEGPDSVENDLVFPWAGFDAATGTNDTVLAGFIATLDGHRSWAMRLDSGTGEVLTEILSPTLPGQGVYGGFAYHGSGVTADAQVWLVGQTTYADRYVVNERWVQWICPFSY